jgi:hypothetical protein
MSKRSFAGVGSPTDLQLSTQVERRVRACRSPASIAVRSTMLTIRCFAKGPSDFFRAATDREHLPLAVDALGRVPRMKPAPPSTSPRRARTVSRAPQDSGHASCAMNCGRAGPARASSRCRERAPRTRLHPIVLPHRLVSTRRLPRSCARAPSRPPVEAGLREADRRGRMPSRSALKVVHDDRETGVSSPMRFPPARAHCRNAASPCRAPPPLLNGVRVNRHARARCGSRLLDAPPAPVRTATV